jgi:hypothetical protein
LFPATRPLLSERAHAKKNFAGYAIPESIPTFGANLHHLQLKHTLHAANMRPNAVQRINPTRPAGNSNRFSPRNGVPGAASFLSSDHLAPKVRQDFKICLKNWGAQQILEEKKHETSLKNAKTRNWQQKFAKCAFFVKTGNPIAMKNP